MWNFAGFAFVEYEDNRDAEDAVRNLDGSRACGSRIRVEMSNGRTRHDGGRRGGGDRGDRRRTDRGGERTRYRFETCFITDLKLLTLRVSQSIKFLI